MCTCYYLFVCVLVWIRCAGYDRQLLTECFVVQRAPGCEDTDWDPFSIEDDWWLCVCVCVCVPIYIYIYIYIYRVIKKSVCTWRLQYKKHAKIQCFKQFVTYGNAVRIRSFSARFFFSGYDEKLRLFEQSPHNWWVEDGHNRIHSECGPCCTEHGLREHSSAYQ